MISDTDILPLLKNVPKQRDMRGLVLLILGCFLLILPFIRDFQWQKGGVVSAELDLFWDSGNPGLVAKKESPPMTAGEIPAYITPMLFKKIPVNRADAEILESIPGIGPKLAQRIIHDRNSNGLFSAADDLIRVPGIGPKRKQNLREYLRFD